MIDEATALTVALCRRFEGFYAAPYLCPAGVPTIGYGATRYADGRIVKLTDSPISKDAAERLLFLTISRDYMPAVLRLCPAVDTPGRLAALTDFAFNLGAGNLKSSTLRRRVNSGDWEAVKVELMRWTLGGGRVLPGLVKRRAAEAAMV
jgi:lysozyme